MPERTDTDAIAELATGAADPVVVEGFDQTDRSPRYIALPPGWVSDVHDPERTAATPRRPVGTVQVHDAASFAAAVTLRQSDDPGTVPVVYADEENLALVAVLNDDQAGIAGWRDHRVELALRKTVEWQHWRNGDDRLLEQEAFAEFIEAGLGEIVSPSAADMLDLAQTFQASTSGRFKAGNRLATGVRQFVYEEEVDASAGTGGTLGIPETIELAVRPFYGSDRYRVDARFRYRLRSGELTLGYKLDRPHEVERSAFTAVRDGVAEALTGIEVIAGRALAAR